MLSIIQEHYILFGYVLNAIMFLVFCGMAAKEPEGGMGMGIIFATCLIPYLAILLGILAGGSWILTKLGIIK